MYHRFRWTSVAARRNGLTAEYEPLQPFLLFALARRYGCRTFADVGANIGSYTVFASQVQTIEQIIAFEANPHAARELRKNVALNGIPATIREAAVSDRPGRVTFGVISRYAGNNAVVETAAQSSEAFDRKVSVEAVTLDDELSGAPGPLCLKIDVEGHEVAVLRGARNILASNQAILQIENYGGEIDEVLAEMGYFAATRIGHDFYFTNIAALRPPEAILEMFETACADLIASNHENKTVTIKRGDFAVQISGKTYRLAKRLAQRVIGRRL